ncbi:neuronal pentraxin-1-like [Etheostoma cragini]|uniref:neuronal pentraxin-1-like n=1 Tax=Etheostoma cragini TaxID=417921 RepID=UPI00155F4B2F|nr:neuronal pentraxin-1-like [Etheostoma cragini]
MARDVSPLNLMPLSAKPHQWVGVSLWSILPFSPLRSLIYYYFLSCAAAAAGGLPGIEYDYGISPKFVCTPIPPEADPSCYSPPSVPHGPSSNGHTNGHNGSSRRGMMSDEAKATILHLRESLVRQKETILDQRETIRELTAKLTLCEGFGGGHHGTDHHGTDHHDNHHDTHHENHHDGHRDDHHGQHGSHHTTSSSHHGSSPYHSSDHHYSHGGHRSDPHHRKPSTYGKHSSFSPEQTGKTLQTLKERLENLQARNSSSSYSSSLRELLQRKITALEEQLHSYYRDTHDYGHHNDHHDDHHDDHRGTGHRDDHHDSHHNSHHGSRRNNHRGSYHNYHHDHHYDRHNSRQRGHYGNHHSPYHYDDHHDGHPEDHHDYHPDDHHDGHHDYHHGPGHHDDHHDDHHDIHHGNDHHDSRHGIDHNPRRLASSGKETNLRGAGHGKLETVLSQLHHGNPDTGNHKKLKSPNAFLLDFPMRTNYMYARMKRSVVNEIFAMTICLRLKAGAGPGLGTPFSYAVPGQANELVLIEWGSNPMELLINDKAVTMPITMTDGKWHHVCMTWTTRDGVWEAYQDGVKKGSGQNLSAWHPIKPGGTFILGQEQDTVGGRFDVTQSFMGELSDLQFWSRVLTPNEIYSQATCGGHLIGDVMSWLEESVELHGGLSEVPFDPCH